MSPKRATSRHIVFKMAKIKVRILKAAREKELVMYKGTPIRLSPDVSTEALQIRREWHNVSKVIKGKTLQPRIHYLARLSFRFVEEIKGFTDKQNLRV